jgi:hypothetical protein
VCEPEPQPESTFTLDPAMDPHRLVAQGGMAATAATAGSIPKKYHWYDAIEDGTSFLFDWLVQENTSYAPTTAEQANDPNKRSISDEEHALMSGMFWGAGRLAAPVVESLGPLLRRVLPNGMVQGLVDPVLAGGTVGTTGAVGDQVVQDATRGEISGWETYADRAVGGLKDGALIGGALGLLGQAGRLFRGRAHETAPAPAAVEAPANPNRQMTKAEWKAAQSQRRRLARENQRIGVHAEKPIDVTTQPEASTGTTGPRGMTKEQYKAADSAGRARSRAESYDDPVGHTHADHGSHVTREQHQERLQDQRTPSGRTDRRPQARSTSFESSAAQTEAVERARAQLQRDRPEPFVTNARTGERRPARYSPPVPVERSGGRPYGGGLERGDPATATGPLHHANVVFEYNPNTGEWVVVTAYPVP